jgi:hypothetical protein
MTKTKISPNFYIDDWKTLDLSDYNSVNWNIAFNIFDDRIKGRFISQISNLKDNPDRIIRNFSGFVIIAIDCLIIETLEQFYNGIKATPDRMSIDSFHNFFQRSPEFCSFFDTRDKSKVFYKQIRCGLLHQAQTGKSSTIHIKKGEPILAWVDNSNINEGIRIHRDKFHTEVENVYKNYLTQLRSKTNHTLLDNFRKKMNIIANQEIN